MKIRLFLLAALAAVLTGCGVSSSVAYYDHKPQLIRAELDGTYVIRSCAKDRNSSRALSEARKRAVYDVIFNGVASASSTVNSLKPLILEVNAKDKYQDYFNEFFADGGDYLKYITAEDKRSASSSFQRSNQRVLCLTNVTVYVAELRKKLKEDNIVK